jgi:hypothetical protein
MDAISFWNSRKRSGALTIWGLGLMQSWQFDRQRTETVDAA